jgi:hypothetical protein
METKLHGAVSDLIIMLSGTFVLYVGGCQLAGVAFYWGIPFEITYGYLQVQCEGGSI